MLDNYYLTNSENFRTFQFESIGPMGIITKVVRYKKIDKNIYSLGFGDKNATTGVINDLAVTNNQDSRKVLATVSKTLYIFTEHYPDAIVIARGSTEARTRLYQMGIANNLTEIEQDFDVKGFTDGVWQYFEQNTTYHAFSARRKKVIS